MAHSKSKAVFFTGTRPMNLLGYSEAPYKELSRYLSAYLESEVLPTHNTFISSGAQGFDQLAFWAVERMKRRRPDDGITNMLALPYPSQGVLWKAEGAFSQQQYNYMKSLADDVWYDTVKQPENRSEATIALMNRNTYMLMQSSMCIALWKEGDSWKNPRTHGGMADALRKAYAEGTEIRILRYQIQDGVLKPLRVDIIDNTGR